MTVKTRQSGQPARVMLRRNKQVAKLAPEGNAVQLPAPSGAPPLFLRLERRLVEIEKRVAVLEGRRK